MGKMLLLFYSITYSVLFFYNNIEKYAAYKIYDILCHVILLFLTLYFSHPYSPKCNDRYIWGSRGR